MTTTTLTLTPLYLTLLLGLSTLLSACLPQPPAAVTATLSLEADQRIRLDWPEARRASYYRVLENIDGKSGFVPIGDGVSTSTNAEVPKLHSLTLNAAPLHRRLNAQYLVQSCNSAGCSDGPAVGVAGNLAAAVSYLKANNADATDSFGHALALSADGRTLAVAAPREASLGDPALNPGDYPGAVYVFYRQQERWQQQAFLKPPQPSSFDLFGRSLSLNANGDRLAIGATEPFHFSEYPVPSGAKTGQVHLFQRQGNQWSTIASPLMASNADSSDAFGNAVSLNAAGNALLVSALLESSVGGFENPDSSDNSLFQSGAAYLFIADSEAPLGWREQALIKAPAPLLFAKFGSELSLAGETDLTMAVAEGLPDKTGQVHLYQYAADSQQLTFQQSLVGAAAGDFFGEAVSLSDDGQTLAVGVPRYQRSGGRLTSSTDDAPTTYQGNHQAGPGRVELYRYQDDAPDGAHWQLWQTLRSGSEGGDGFGQSLAFSPGGDWLAVGAFGDDNTELQGVQSNPGASANQPHNQTDNNSGAVFLYHRDNGLWSLSRYIKASNPDANDWFGEAVSLSKDGQLAVGASAEDSDSRNIGGDQHNNRQYNSGAVYLY